MGKTFKIAVFDGDGIGPEIMHPTVALLKGLAARSDEYDFAFDTVPAGAAHYVSNGESLPDASLETARAADAILLSAMGLPSVRYPDGTEISPQIEIRKTLNLYAGVRPVRIAPGQPTPLALKGGQTVDFVLIRESTEGLFHSQGTRDVRNDEEAYETLKITRATSEKLHRFAFKLAQNRKATGRSPGKVTCVDKANVFAAFAFFRKIFDEQAALHPQISHDHAYVDATALWMVEKPWVFDVLVTENMFGDILSDLGAGLMGGLGLAPSADIGDEHAVFQPCHGSAPDIAGQGIANPFAMILSAAMMLDWLGETHGIAALSQDGTRLREAVEAAIADRDGVTRDLGGTASTSEAAEAIAARLL
ncbi:3-isopropylmalate dehydrogenase [Litoreibacter ponti]|uniref:3-isopropylmalate dehydrogenase n=1 Tax=Litoreibacter ponti TaxID=1510457 RepID=A0A2T6BHJ1_9RHOB|nr:isocitrate/isopropylmalate family dehydrogenase [Litoreibacter ponti]PTX55506.1 3-isopropylmalate dehydrogenase [Litoreibacter ponti]